MTHLAARYRASLLTAALFVGACKDDARPPAASEDPCAGASRHAYDAVQDAEERAHRPCTADADCELVALDTSCSTACLPSVASHDGADALRRQIQSIDDALCRDGSGGKCAPRELDCESGGELAAVCHDGECAVAAL